jgi:hypothetical protein
MIEKNSQTLIKDFSKEDIKSGKTNKQTNQKSLNEISNCEKGLDYDVRSNKEFNSLQNSKSFVTFEMT